MYIYIIVIYFMYDINTIILFITAKNDRNTRIHNIIKTECRRIVMKNSQKKKGP